MSNSNPDSDANKRSQSPSHQAFDSGEPLPVSARLVKVVEPGESGEASRNDPDDEPLGMMGRSKVAILLTVFIAAGITGLPLILLSRRFSRPEKIFWTIATLAYTVLVFYLFYLAIVWISQQLQTL